MSRLRIAIVGAGISGLTVAHRLHRDHDVTVFEAGEHPGGHTNTVDVESAGRRWAVDTGFIVFNDWTYPSFIALLDELGVASQPSDMSFSVHCEASGLEYCGSSLNRLFAQRRNLVSPGFYRMLADVLRFNRASRDLLAGDDGALTLGEYLDRAGYSRRFVRHYVVPMGAAIWSARPEDMLAFPARRFVEFFDNHGMLNVKDRPAWRVVRGGSREYVRALTAPFADRIRLSTPVTAVRRLPDRVHVATRRGAEDFDAVFLACHSDQALRLIADPAPAEREVLSAVPYQENVATLHTDTRLLPERRAAWAAWNYRVPATPRDRVSVTYNMNILQGLDAPETFCVTLNEEARIRPERVIRRIVYQHPVFMPESVGAQARRPELDGVNRTFFCGAWWGYGFHEDGVKSGLAALESFERWKDERELPLRRAG